MASWLDRYRHRANRPGSSTLTEYLPILFGQVARYPGAVIAEIGTDIGDSTCTLLAGAELTGGHVWSVDINPQVRFLEEYAEHDGPDLWTFICGDSSAQTVARKVPGEIDVLYVDGDHRYDQVCAEINLYLPRVKGGGIALFHDTNFDPWAQPDMFRVDDALNDTLPRLGANLHWEAYPGRAGLGIVRIPAKRPCAFCPAQATAWFTAKTERQQMFAGGSPVEVCAGCLIEAERQE